MKDTAIPPTPPRLVRVSENCLNIEGLRCGISDPRDKGCGAGRRFAHAAMNGGLEPRHGGRCGGELYVIDWHPQGVRGEYRYEIVCRKCHRADPNGWPRQEDILKGAREYFSATEGGEE